MKIENIPYDCFNSFFKDIIPTGKMSILSGFIFRGESTASYKLIPSALREENKSKLYEGSTTQDADLAYWQIFQEHKFLKSFYDIANYNGLKVPYKSPNELINIQKEKYKWILKDFEELAALAQHYGILTRLLDWTFDIYIALYFAAIGVIKKELNKEDISNDSIVIWALNAKHIQYLNTTKYKSPLNIVIPSYYNNPNLNAQKGVLSYWEIEMDAERLGKRNLTKVDRTPLDKLISNCDPDNGAIVLYKLKFPASDCIEVFDYLKKMGYEASRLFPGYGGISKCIKERTIVNQVKKNRNKL